MTRIASRIGNRVFRAWLIARGAKIASGCVVSRPVDITNYRNLTIGTDSILYKNVTAYIGERGSLLIGSHSHVAPFCYFLVGDNELKIGDHVAMGPFCACFCHSNHYSPTEPIFAKARYDADIRIGSNVFIGSHCVVLPGAEIENDIIVGANSVVRGHLCAGSVYAGNPAKCVRRL